MLRIVAILLIVSSYVHASQPNIVVVMVDDLSTTVYDAARDAGYMPHIEGLRNRSCRFTNHISTTPVCCAARAAFLTAKLATNNGVWNNDRGWAMNANATFPKVMQDNGYQTAIVGKYLNDVGNESGSQAFYQANYQAPGWNHWLSIVGATPIMYGYKLNENGVITQYDTEYQTDLIASRAVALMGQMQEPYLVYVCPTAPHGEAGVPSLKLDCGTRDDWKIRPATRHESTPFIAAPRPVNYNEADLTDKPWSRPLLTEQQQQNIDEVFSSKVAAMRAVDDLVGQVVSIATTNTIIAFVSDQGYLHGEHRLVSKGVPYEEAITSIAWLSMPGQTTGKDVSALVGLVDFGPTFLDAAAITIPPGLDGISLSGLIDGSVQNIRERIQLFQLDQKSGGGAAVSFTGWRTGGNHPSNPNAAWWDWTPSGLQEAYDLTSDENQLQSIGN